MTEEQRELRNQHFKFSLTGAGIAAILASILPIIVLFRGEPTAEKVADRSDQENQRLFRNQRKLHARLSLAEAKLELFEKICVKSLKPAPLVSDAVAHANVKSIPARPKTSPPTLPPTTTAAKPAPPPKKCRQGLVLEEDRCVPVRTALKARTAALDKAQEEKRRLLMKAKAAFEAKRKAEQKAKTAKQQHFLPAPPAPLLKK